MKLWKKPEPAQSKLQEVKEGLTGLAVLAVLGAIGWTWLTSEDEAQALAPDIVATAAVSDIAKKSIAIAESQAAAEARAEADRAEADRIAATRQIEEQAERKRTDEKAEQDAHDRRQGFHCLDNWNGSHRALVKATKAVLNDPDSFQHDETRTWPVRPDGRNRIFMTYRAKNGFGALVMGKATGTFDNTSCDIKVDSIQ